MCLFLCSLACVVGCFLLAYLCVVVFYGSCVCFLVRRLGCVLFPLLVCLLVGFLICVYGYAFIGMCARLSLFRLSFFVFVFLYVSLCSFVCFCLASKSGIPKTKKIERWL